MWWRPRDVAEQEEADDTPAFSPQLVAALDLLRAGAMIIGEHDQVLYATAAARSMGAARGSRIGQAEVLDLVRQVRRDATSISIDAKLPRGIAVEPLPAHVRMANLGEGNVVVLIEDQSASLRVDATRRDFVANISHELKTPIGAVSVLAEAIEVAADDPDQVVHFAHRMQREAARLGQLVSQIIELSRLQSEDPGLDLDDVDINDIVGDALSRTREMAEQRDVNLIVIRGDDIWASGDRNQLTDAIANLIHNAISYSDAGARVAITTRLTPTDDVTFAEVIVADNGIGIRAEDQERIFERFYRVDYGRSRETGGTGLGLSIVRHIASQHGGTISVWSKPGQGSTFTLRLPALTDHPNDTDFKEGEPTS